MLRNLLKETVKGVARKPRMTKAERAAEAKRLKEDVDLGYKKPGDDDMTGMGRTKRERAMDARAEKANEEAGYTFLGKPTGKGMKKGGKVKKASKPRGSGCAKRGVKKCKMY